MGPSEKGPFPEDPVVRPWLWPKVKNLNRARPLASTGVVPTVFQDPDTPSLAFFVSVATPAEPRGEKKTFFCTNFRR